jgi:hypothetical protein
MSPSSRIQSYNPLATESPFFDFSITVGVNTGFHQSLFGLAKQIIAAKVIPFSPSD